MGLAALGFRNLLIKLSIFFVMAALLAWALGGTLWPRAETADFPAVQFNGKSWFWRLSVGGRIKGQLHWQLMYINAEQSPQPFSDQLWAQVVELVAAPEGLYYAACDSLKSTAPWQITRIDQNNQADTIVTLPDRLAVERQLVRIRTGLPIESLEAIENERPIVLDPASSTASDN